MHWKTKRKLSTIISRIFIAIAIACGLAIGIGLTNIVSKDASSNQTVTP